VSRAQAALVAGALALCLIAGSTPRLAGDGGEYLAMAINLASGHRPALASADVYPIWQRVAAADAALGDWDIRSASFAGRDGRRDFAHFWFYPLLAVPALWVTQTLAITPIAAFTITNVVLLALAFWIALPRLGPALTVLLFGSPIFWWIDKPHTEAFTFALLLVAFVLVDENLPWALVAAGAAAAQNLPIACVICLMLAGRAITQPSSLRDRRLIAGAVSAIALAALQPVYTYVRHGTPTLLLQANPNHTPSWAELLAVPFDPVIGLLANFPFAFLLVLGALVVILRRRPRELLRVDIVVASLSAAAFLFSFAQASNVHHGGTPSISRYAIWLLPLLAPIARRAAAVGQTSWRRFVWPLAAVSAIACVFAFHPRVLQNTREPTWLADFLWRQHPAVNNPLPEIFAETLMQREDRWVPIATQGCEKVLFMGRGDGSAFPIPCFPESPPGMCAVAGALCYANRVGTHYEFARAPGSAVHLEGFLYQKDWAWPQESLAHVRRLLMEAQWWTLKPRAGGEDILRQTDGVHAFELEGNGRMLFILRDAGGDARITLRPASRMTGVMSDATSGSVVRLVTYDGAPFERWEIPVPRGALYLLSLWES
jgi:hypothetical protein